MASEMVLISREALGVFMSAAEIRQEQYERHSLGLDPYETDCIYECDEKEAANMVKLYEGALKEYARAVSRQS